MIGQNAQQCAHRQGASDVSVGRADLGNDAVLLIGAAHEIAAQGLALNVAHLAAAPLGMTVTFTAEVIGVTDRRIQFRVEARDEKEKIGEGTHERAIINVARFTAKMAAKGT